MMTRDVNLAYGVVGVCSLAPLLLPVPVPLQMVPLCVALILIGCKNSLLLSQPTDGSPAPPKMEAKEVYMFPIMGSIVLFSLYLVYKFLPPAWINVLVKAYFVLLGVFVLASQLTNCYMRFLPKSVQTRLKALKFSFRVPFWSVIGRFFDDGSHSQPSPAAAAAGEDSKTGDTAPDKATAATEEDGDESKSRPAEGEVAQGPDVISGDASDLIGFGAAVGIAVWYVLENHWLSSNLFGMAFTIQALEWIHLDAYFHGFFLLSGLCVYDIFWVFGTDVMVTVARFVDGPIKLLFPQPYLPNPSMLGLGDIVIPGIVISLLLSFDRHQARTRSPNPEPGKKFPTPYFHVALVLYTLGLLTTLGVMYWFKAAQPALLYLSPAILIASLGTALYRGEFKQLWGFTQSPPPPKSAAEAEKQKED